MQQDLAEEIATQGLGWLCGQDDLLPVFLAASGADLAGLRSALAAPTGPDSGLLVAALDFILMQDATVLDCAQAVQIAPDRVLMAHAVLSGQAGMHWT